MIQIFLPIPMSISDITDDDDEASDAVDVDEEAVSLMGSSLLRMTAAVAAVVESATLGFT